MTVLTPQPRRQLSYRSPFVVDFRAADWFLPDGSPAVQGDEITCRSGQIITTTRDGRAYSIDQNGRLGLVPKNSPRFGYSGGEPHLLGEDARTNTFTHSEDFPNVAWVKTEVNESGNQTTAPDGTTTADSILETAASSNHLVHQTLTSTASTVQAFSAFVKAIGRDFAYIRSDLRDGSTLNTWFNLSTGAVATQNHATATIKALGDSWFRIGATWDSLTGANAELAGFGPADADNNVSYAGDITKGLYAWGGMYEKDEATVSSYIQTVASAVSRAVETISLTFGAAPQEMTIYVSLADWVGGLAVGTILHIGSGVSTADPRISLDLGGGGVINATYDDGTTVAGTGNITAPADGDDVELLAPISAAGVIDLAASKNSGAQEDVASGAGGALPSALAGQLLYINSGGTSNHSFNKVREVRIALGTKTMAQMRTS